MISNSLVDELLRLSKIQPDDRPDDILARSMLVVILSADNKDQLRKLAQDMQPYALVLLQAHYRELQRLESILGTE